jgi:hypothetical protein
MARNEIHVVRAENGSWLVTGGSRPSRIRAFRLRSHAMAFGSAVALSRGQKMVVHNSDGSQTRHHRASLTYPTNLD